MPRARRSWRPAISRRSRQRILEILDSDARIPYVEQARSLVLQLLEGCDTSARPVAAHDADEYRKAQPAWETVLDLDALAAAENENWVWQGAECLRPAYKRCLVSLSRGGADASVVREFDLESEVVRQGRLRAARGEERRRLARRRHALRRHRFRPRLDDDIGLSAHRQRCGKRGTPLADAETMFERRARRRLRSYGLPRSRRRASSAISSGAASPSTPTSCSCAAAGRTRSGSTSPTARLASVASRLAARRMRDDWTIGGTTYPAGALLAADFEGFLKGGARLRRAVRADASGRSLDGYEPDPAPRPARTSSTTCGAACRCIDARRRQVDARGAAGRAGARHRRPRARSMPTSRTTTS